MVSLIFAACNSDDNTTVQVGTSDELPLISGSANFSKYIALGNSLTSGFSYGTLFNKGKEGDYTNILVQQFKLVEGGEFKIPYTNDNTWGITFWRTSKFGFLDKILF